MIKYFAIINIVILFSHENRCFLHPTQNRERPNLQTYYLSNDESFKIHYDLDGNNAPDLTDLNNNSIPDYIEEVAIIAQDSRHTLINVMGYLSEPDDGDGIYDIYIVNQTAWGWNVPESAITGASYIKIDNDYLGTTFNSSFCLNNIDKMRVSVAHEFFHAIQRSYRPNYNTDHDFLLEMSSMWFEDLMVPDCNDYLSFTNYSSGIFKKPDQNFDGSESSNSASFGYSMALFGHYLSRIIDPNGLENQQNSTIIREIWENYQNQSNQIEVNAAGQSIINILSEYDITFSDVWSDFISRNIFSGQFDYYNQDFYYYTDQQYMSPVSLANPSTIIIPGYEYDLLSALNSYSASIVKLKSDYSQLINLNYLNNNCEFDNVSIIGDINTFFKYEDLSLPLILNPSDIMYLISSSDVLVCDNLNFQVSSSLVPDDLIKLYPNPVYYNGDIFIQIDSYESIDNVLFEIFDANGKLLINENKIFSNAPIYINIKKKLKVSGVYLLKISYNKKTYKYKFSYIK